MAKEKKQKLPKISADQTDFPQSERNKHWILTIGFLVVALMFCVPHILNWWEQMQSVNVIGGITRSVEGLSESKLKQLKQSAEEYNEWIYEQQKQTTFDYRGAKADKSDKRYNKELKTDKDSNVMAELVIKKLHLDLPIAHGTRAVDLDHELGHMYGSSLPWGGKNTHSVIAGHTGLKSVDLFTHLDKMKKGDTFEIYVLDEIHTYKVDQIKVVLPEEEAPYLQIEDGKDLCTLYTCTPVGINDHRLLVRGHRIGTRKAGGEGNKNRLRNLNLYTILHFLLWFLPPIVILVLGYLLYKKKKEEAEAKAREKQAEIPANPEVLPPKKE